MSTNLGQLMAELDKAGLKIGLDKRGRWNFVRFREGEVNLNPEIAQAIRDRWSDAVQWAEGTYDGPDGDQQCPVCSSWVTPVGRKEGFIFGVCDVRTEPGVFDRKSVLCPYRNKE
jgi:hypothetical protein